MSDQAQPESTPSTTNASGILRAPDPYGALKFRRAFLLLLVGRRLTAEDVGDGG